MKREFQAKVYKTDIADVRISGATVNGLLNFNLRWHTIPVTGDAGLLGFAHNHLW